jgi:hypothetical protein
MSRKLNYNNPYYKSDFNVEEKLIESEYEKEKSHRSRSEYPLYGHTGEKHKKKLLLKQYKNQSKSVPVVWCVSCDKHVVAIRDVDMGWVNNLLIKDYYK